MILRLRRRHRTWTRLLAVLVPAVLVWALATRRLPPEVEHAPGAASEHAGHGDSSR